MVVVVQYNIAARCHAVRLVPELACPLCGTAGGVEMSVFQEYLGVFGLPVTPMARFGAAYCHHCRQPIPRKSNKEGLRSAFEAVAATVPRSPLRAYAGTIVWVLIAVAGLGGFAVAKVQQQARQETRAQMLARMADPKPGDIDLVTVYPRGGLAYTLFKVVSVSGDNVTLRVHRETKSYQEVPLEAQAFSAFSLKDSDFSGATFVVRKSDFAKHALPNTPLAHADIKEVRRPPQP